LKGIFCRNPTLLDLEDEAEEDKLSQFFVKYVPTKYLLVFIGLHVTDARKTKSSS
jgi:hypothetical protein